ncbi:hypothetical protein M422DRAFT_159975 [Sphaerobolus stellatus SS14]|nr:hypothetical protein M422DRAFT_159975 [Sphaerobolus stellatus SS14]
MMLKLMNQLSNKPNWDQEIFDEEIAVEWRTKALMTENLDIAAVIPAPIVTDNMIDWCIAELRYRANSFQRTGAISVFTAYVVKSDSVVPLTLKQEFQEAVKVLENVPSHDKDQHPGSNNKVLDLAHPSLFPLVYGTSQILKDKLTTLDNCI